MTARISLSILIIFLKFYFSVTAQNTYQRDAAEFFKKRNYFAAIKLYDKLLEENPTVSEYFHKAAICYLNTNNDKTLAIDYLEKAIKLAKADPETYFDLGLAYQYAYRFDDAINSYHKYLEIITSKDREKAYRQIETCNNARQLLKFPLNVTFSNLGPEINTEYPDYYPFIAPDESFLLFTTRRKGAPSLLEFDGYYSSDIYISLNNKGKFESAKGIGTNINTSYDEQVVGISADGNNLFVYMDHIKDFGDIYISEKKLTQGYKKPVKLGKNVNSPYLETSGAISPDGNTLIFASNRPGGLGGRDLYMSRKLPDGEWGHAQSMGDVVNTTYNEDFPNFLADGVTIYFASQGHNSMGGYDIFYTVWDPNEHTFTNPVNIGYPINNPEDNFMITFNDDMSRGYISTRRNDGFGDLDIYAVTFNDILDKPTIYRCFLNSADTLSNVKPPVLYLTNLETGEKEGIYMANIKNKSYLIAVLPGKYEINLEAEGFEPYNEILIVTESKKNQPEINKDLFIKPINYKSE
jgi:tetratricopeptide (TPR) repeat protein